MQPHDIVHNRIDVMKRVLDWLTIGVTWGPHSLPKTFHHLFRLYSKSCREEANAIRTPEPKRLEESRSYHRRLRGGKKWYHNLAGSYRMHGWPRITFVEAGLVPARISPPKRRG